MKPHQIKSIVQAKQSGEMGALNHASLSRVYWQWQESGASSLAVLGAALVGEPDPERSKRLLDEARSLAEGAGGILRHLRREGAVERSADEAVWAYGMSLESVIRLAREYEQAAFLFAGPETSGAVEVIGKDGERLASFADISPPELTEAYSKALGTAALFEWRPASAIEAYFFGAMASKGDAEA